MFSVGYANREPAWQMNRDFFVEGFNDPGTPANYPRIDYPYYTPAADQPAVAGRRESGARHHGEPVAHRRLLYQSARRHGVPAAERARLYRDRQTFPYKIRTHNSSLEEGSPRSYASTPLTRYSSFGRSDLRAHGQDVRRSLQGTFVMTDVDTVLFPTPLTGVPVPHGNGVYAPSVDAQGNTLAAYRPGGVARPQLRADGRLHELASWPVPAELGRRCSIRGSSTPTGAGPLPAGAPGTGMNQDWTMSRIAYWYPNRASSNETKLERVHRRPRGHDRRHRLDVGGLYVVRRDDSC